MTGLILDVSNNRVASLQQVKDAKAVALICKATEGANFEDATLAAHRAIAEKLEIPFGSYLFIHPDSTGSEAKYYLDYAKPKKGDIQPIIDAETFTGTYKGKTGAQALALRVESCARALVKAGYEPIIYAGPYSWPQLVKYAPYIKRFKVWEAQYPGKYTKWIHGLLRLRMRILGAKVVMWQFTDTFEVGGEGFDASHLYVPIKSILI